MPGGIPVGTLAIGDSGAKNAGILAAQIVGNHDKAVRERVSKFRSDQTQNVLKATLVSPSNGDMTKLTGQTITQANTTKANNNIGVQNKTETQTKPE